MEREPVADSALIMATGYAECDVAALMAGVGVGSFNDLYAEGRCCACGRVMPYEFGVSTAFWRHLENDCPEVMRFVAIGYARIAASAARREAALELKLAKKTLAERSTSPVGLERL